MRKILTVAICLAVFCVSASSAWASGGKERGDSGQGAVNQVGANSQGNQS